MPGKMPDWLISMTNDATGLVDDSPQFREAEQNSERANIASASMEALKMVRQDTRQEQLKAAQAGIGALKAGQQQIDAITPIPTPESPVPFFSTPETSNVPDPAVFDPEPTVLPPPQMEVPVPATGEVMPTQDEDPVQIVNQVAEASGLTPQVVAMMTLLGKEIGDLEERGEATYSDIPPPTPAPPANSGIPSFGGPPPPSPLSQPVLV